MSTSNFDLSKPKERRFDLTKDTDSQPSRNWKKIVGITVTVAVLGAGGLIGYKFLNPSGNKDPQPDVVATDTTSSTLIADSSQLTVSPGATVSEVIESTDTQETTDEQQGNTDTDIRHINDVVASQNDLGTIEEAAISVIRGNYGNNPIRKRKLGDRYQEIQDKVNQMYREGLVH